jgi:polyisoprenoid-binding protein YceI
MKLNSNKALLVGLVLTSSLGYVVSCTHKGEDLPAPATNTIEIVRGTHVHLPGTLKAGDSTQWKMDKAHSSVMWSTNYVGAAGLLTGRFNQFGIHNVVSAEQTTYTASGQPLKDTGWAFYENDPAKTYFAGYVQINTSNTGEPGRDTGCNISALGTVKITPGQYNLTTTNLAQIKTREVKFDPTSADYIVTLDLTWKGTLAAPLTKTLTGKLKYIPQARVNNTYDVFGLQLIFQFNCRDFGVTSTSVSDNITIECNMNFNNK